MESNNLKILMISYDRKILEPGSSVAERMGEYAALVGELHIVVMSKAKHELKNTKLGENIWIYPTNSLSRWLYPFDAAKIGKKIVYENKFVRGRSLITTHDPFESGWAGTQIRKKWRIPLEVQLHTDPFSNEFYGMLNFIRKVIAKKVFRNADHFRVVSESLAGKMEAYYSIEAAKISVLPIYIDTKKIVEGNIKFDLHALYGWHFILLTVTRLTSEKNLGFMLGIMKKVIERFPTTGLVIVGSGPLEESLKEQAQKMGLENNVKFVGWNEDLYSYYHTANAYIQTSKYEGYGLSLIEAGLSGLPIVSTPVGIVEELENGKDLYIAPHGNLTYFRDAIFDLIENNRAREELKVNIKNTLNKKVLSKDEFLAQLKKNWEETALNIK